MSESPKTPNNLWKISSCRSSQQRHQLDTSGRRPLAGHRRPGVSHSAKKGRRLGNFKSPFRNHDSTAFDVASVETAGSVHLDITKLNKKTSDLDKEIDALKDEGYREEELSVHICKMHEYNELKDTGQMLLGKLAELEGVPVRDLYKTFELDIAD
ncbi:DNA repair protein SWI5 homolog [Glandiceps talaboti]